MLDISLLPTIFSECVDMDSATIYSVYKMTQPFIVDGYVYMTDGRIAIRMPSRTDEPNTEGKFPPVKDLNWDASAYPIEIAVPDPGPEQPPETCPECNGDKEVAELKCKECFGYGKVTCEYDCEHDCGECYGTGNLRNAGECEMCDGTGLKIKQRILKFDIEPEQNNGLAEKYARLLRKYNAKAFAQEGGMRAIKPIRFEIKTAMMATGTIEGLVMPAIIHH